MVCNRCVMVVRDILNRAGIKVIAVVLGEVELELVPTENQLAVLNTQLKKYGFELLDDKNQKQIERIKNLIIHKVQSGDIEDHFSIADYLAKRILKEYSSISRLFSGVEGITIEQYFILQKIEKVKEWLVYGEMTLSEIAVQLGYSSVAHLSAQFKKVTGITPGNFKKQFTPHRKSLDEL